MNTILGRKYYAFPEKVDKELINFLNLVRAYLWSIQINIWVQKIYYKNKMN